MSDPFVLAIACILWLAMCLARGGSGSTGNPPLVTRVATRGGVMQSKRNRWDFRPNRNAGSVRRHARPSTRRRANYSTRDFWDREDTVHLRKMREQPLVAAIREVTA